MLRYLLSVCSIFVLLLPTITFQSRAHACPVKLPETLLSLYRNSDAIYLAKFDKIEDAEIIENSEERTVVRTKQHFDISSTLKGESRKLFVFEEEDYRYKSSEVASDGEGEEPAEEVQSGDDVDLFGRAELKTGDPVILFLKTDEDGTLGLTDYRDAIKKMSLERRDIYEARIRELNSIFAAKKVDDSAVVDWLVNCAKDPITRWEGAYELQRSFERLAWQKERDKEQAEEAEAAGNSENVDQEITETGEEEVVESEEFDNSVYAKLLTENQKEVLTNIVLESESKGSGSETDVPRSTTRGDQALLEVVLNWGDTRLARLLVDRLQTGSGESYMVSEWMQKAAGILNDDELTKISSRYSDVYYQGDDEFVEEASDSTDSSVANTTAEITEEDSAADKVDLTSDDAQSRPPKVTYKQLRAELVGKFVDRSVTVIAAAENQQVERAAR